MMCANWRQSCGVLDWTTSVSKLVVDEGASHHESAWARRFPDALSFLFGERT